MENQIVVYSDNKCLIIFIKIVITVILIIFGLSALKWYFISNNHFRKVSDRLQQGSNRQPVRMQQVPTKTMSLPELQIDTEEIHNYREETPIIREIVMVPRERMLHYPAGKLALPSTSRDTQEMDWHIP